MEGGNAQLPLKLYRYSGRPRPAAGRGQEGADSGDDRREGDLHLWQSRLSHRHGAPHHTEGKNISNDEMIDL